MADELLTYGEQARQTEEGFLNPSTGLAVGGAGAISALGFYKLNSGQRLWDKFNRGVSAVESISPGGILKTFRVSELLSTLETQTEEDLTKFLNTGKYGEMLKKSLPEATLTKNIKFVPGSGAFGDIVDEAGDVLGTGIRIRAGSQQGNAIADFYARVLGVELGPQQSINDAILRQAWEETDLKVPFNIWRNSLPQSERYRNIVLAAPVTDTGKRVAKAKVLSKLGRAHQAAQIGRLSVLLRKPLDLIGELPGIGNIVNKIPGLGVMAAPPGTATSMLGSFVKKAAVAGAAWKALEYADYLRSEDSLTAMPLTTGIFAAAGGIGLAQPGAPFSKTGLLGGALAGLAVSILPRFNEGIFYGAASLFSDADTIRAHVSDITGYTQALKEQNEITRGLISTSTALGFAGTGALLTGLGSYGAYLKDVGVTGWKERAAEETLSNMAERKRYESGALIKEFWSSERGRKLADKPLLGKLSKIKSPLALGAIAGAVVWQSAATALSLLSGNIRTAIPGLPLLMSDESAEEKHAIYSGEKEVAIRKGRFWEMGRSSYEGENIEFFRQHFIPRLRARAYQKGLWGDESEKWAHDPMLNPIKALFGSDEWKYYYERKYAYERGAPVSGTYFEDVPFIGPLLAATFGELLKPRKAIRPEEWDMGGGSYLYRPGYHGETEPAYQYGGMLPGSPVMPGETTQLLNELNYRRTEMIGLPGFMEETIREAFTGRAEPFQNLQTFEAMGGETSTRTWFWEHLNVGGFFGTSEAIRRFIPAERSYLQTYNPLKNNLPSWMPENHYLDLKYGNPLKKIKEGEIRLPGSGFSALHPETQGLSPEEYPLAYRVKILGDVAAESNIYETALREAKSKLHSLPPNQAKLILDTERQVKAKKRRKEFDERVTLINQTQKERVTVTEIISPHLVKTKEYGTANIEVQGIGSVKNAEEAMEYMRKALMGREITIHTPTDDVRKFDSVNTGPRVKALVMMNGSVDIAEALERRGLIDREELDRDFAQTQFSPNEKLAGVLSDALLRAVETPFDYLTPFAPAQKLIHQRSAIEDYIATQAVGTKNAFWDRPIENFITPAKDMFLYQSGLKDGPPDRVKEKRKINEYFDMLKWVKYSQLEQKARTLNDLETVSLAAREKRNTVFGADIFGSSGDIKKALPRAERDYFDAFSQAKNEEERQRILSLVPENLRRVYTTQWLSKAAAASYARKEAGSATKQDLENINRVRQLRASQGFDYHEGQVDMWMRDTNGQIPFDEYIRELKAAEYFATHSLPDPSWIGFCVPPDQKIMNENFIPVDFSDINTGDNVYTTNGANTVKQIFKRTVDEELVKISVYHNKVDSMTATKNHLVLAIKAKKCPYNLHRESVCIKESKSWRCHFCQTQFHNNYKLEWIPIEEIDTDTFLPVPYLKHTEENPKYDLGELSCWPENTVIGEKTLYPSRGQRHPLNRFIEIDESFSWLIGYYLAEGNIWKTEGRTRGVQFTAHVKELPILELANKIIKEKLGVSGKIRIKKTPNSHSAYLMVANQLFACLIEHWAGRYCDKKIMPEWLENITHESQLAIAEGIWTGDGDKDRIRICMANENLIRLTKSIYESSGFPVSFRKLTRRNYKEVFILEKINNTLNAIITDSFIAYRVEKIEKIKYSGEVFDMEVEGTHNYCSPIGVFHNSPAVDLEDIKLKYVEDAGLSYHDFDLWDQRKISLARKPYVAIAAQQLSANAEYRTSYSAAQEFKRINSNYGMGKHKTNIYQIDANLGGNRYNITVDDHRQGLVNSAFKSFGVW